jgi:two-component system, sensor histidine kinase and response regulator
MLRNIISDLNRFKVYNSFTLFVMSLLVLGSVLFNSSKQDDLDWLIEEQNLLNGLVSQNTLNIKGDEDKHVENSSLYEQSYYELRTSMEKVTTLIRRSQRLETVTLCVSLLLFLLLILYVFFQVNKLKGKITASTKNLKEGIKEITNGNFSYKLTDKLDGIGPMMNDMVTVLNDSRQEAERANEAKSQFLANMSHEIRTPLNSIIGYSEILADDELSFEHRTMTRSIKNSSETLLSLINDILDLAKIESGGMSLEHIPVNLEDICYDVCESQLVKVDGEQMEIHVEFNDTYALVYTDPLRMKQILMNVVGNAVKFTKKGEIVLSVDVLEEDEKSIKLKLSICDTGIGMTESQAQVIFDAFKQADGSTTRQFGGTGLGLSISKQILAEMGGEIKVKSTLDVGSDFFFELHFKKHFPDRDENFVVTSKLKDKNVLIVDDNCTALQILTDYFTKVGIKCFLANSATEALEYLSSNKVDIMLLDLMMPRVDGFTLAHKTQTQFPEIKVIAMTADIRPGTMARVKEEEFEAYLFKPIRRKVLYQTLLSLYLEQTELLNEAEVQYHFHPKKVLIVDDNKVNLTLALKVFSKMGHMAETAASGKSALLKVEESEYDMIFMDMKMPEMNGVETTVELRQRGVKTPIVALTANAYASDRRACLDAGMDDFMSKPIRRDVLYELIHKYTSAEAEYHEVRVLIVEEDLQQSEEASTIIKQHFPGAIVKTAFSRIEAFTLIGSFLPHILILDFIFPDIDGVKVMEFLNSHENYRDVKVMLNSRLKLSDERVQQMMNMGAMSAICKDDPEKDHMLEMALKKSGFL